MNEQKRDLIQSRARLERGGETFNCADCGVVLPPVSMGGFSDYCDACEAKFCPRCGNPCESYVDQNERKGERFWLCEPCCAALAITYNRKGQQ